MYCTVRAVRFVCVVDTKSPFLGRGSRNYAIYAILEPTVLNSVKKKHFRSYRREKVKKQVNKTCVFTVRAHIFVAFRRDENTFF